MIYVNLLDSNSCLQKLWIELVTVINSVENSLPKTIHVLFCNVARPRLRLMPAKPSVLSSISLWSFRGIPTLFGYTSMNINTIIHICLYIYTYYKCVCRYVYMYIHTYIHMCSCQTCVFFPSLQRSSTVARWRETTTPFPGWIWVKSGYLKNWMVKMVKIC